MKSVVPTVSVIIPIYNTGPYLTDCLDSISNQTLRDIEIICVDDGSTDDTPAILEAYRLRDERIRVIRKENGGIGMARNTGIRAACGKYLYFMDSDDRLDADALEILTEKMERLDLQLICFNTTLFGSDRDSIAAARRALSYYQRELDDDIVCSGPELQARLLSGSRYLCVVWLNVVRRDLVMEHELWFQREVHEDESWTFSVMMYAQRCSCINRAFFHHRFRENSFIRQHTTFDNTYGYFRASRDMIRAVENSGATGEALEAAIVTALHIQDNSIWSYRACSPEERQRLAELPLDEQILFRQLTVNTAALYDRLSKVRSELTRTKKELTKTKKTLSTVKSSPSWRIGRMLTYIPRQIRSAAHLLVKGLAYLRDRRRIMRHKFVIRLQDRLGDQMFLYALYLKLTSLGRDTAIDDTFLQKEDGLLGDAFDLHYPQAAKREILWLQDKGEHRSDRLLRRLFGARPRLLQASDCRVLSARSGYITGQSRDAGLLDGLDDALAGSFRFRAIDPLNLRACEMEARIRKDPGSVALHYKACDGSPEGGADAERVCMDGYYARAIRAVREAMGGLDMTLYVFSDDPGAAAQWVTRQAGSNPSALSGETLVVDVCAGGDDWVDMYLMSLCRHNVIADSPFSWWAARLNANPDKIVIGPSVWRGYRGELRPGPSMDGMLLLDASGELQKEN